MSISLYYFVLFAYASYCKELSVETFLRTYFTRIYNRHVNLFRMNNVKSSFTRHCCPLDAHLSRSLDSSIYRFPTVPTEPGRERLKRAKYYRGENTRQTENSSGKRKTFSRSTVWIPFKTSRVLIRSTNLLKHRDSSLSANP